ncbi:MAG: hypothetical protein P4L57_06490 [Rhizomicrobium sp.]|nr:hypothetical protein [Rhizomicrobium sp.]
MLSQRLQPSNGLETASSLAVAGRKAYQIALQERLALATIAEQSGRAPYWFASNLLLVVDTYGSQAEMVVLLTREATNGLKLSDDMLSLVTPGSRDAIYGDLKISAEQFERYLKWARTVS